MFNRRGFGLVKESKGGEVGRNQRLGGNRKGEEITDLFEPLFFFEYLGPTSGRWELNCEECQGAVQQSLGIWLATGRCFTFVLQRWGAGNFFKFLTSSAEALKLAMFIAPGRCELHTPAQTTILILMLPLPFLRQFPLNLQRLNLQLI